MATFTAHQEHAPRPAGDPDYVPYWAKGEYARQNGTKYTTESGVTIVAGEVTEGSPRRSEARELSKYPPQAQKAKETPSVASERVRKAPRTPDLVDQLLAVHRTLDARTVLCRSYGVDPAILTTAPNPGVASMRLANALRKAIGGAA